MDMTEFWTICSANGINLELKQLKAIERFAGELVYWNKKINMVSRADEENLLEKHVLHSLAILKYVNIPQKAKCLDVGTGGGLPGIPLKIARPDLRMLLVDSINKKLRKAAMFAQHTALKGIEAKAARAEELAKDKRCRQSYDFIFARAVKRLEKLAGWVKPLMKPAARLVVMKGGDLREEIEEAQAKFTNLEVEEYLIDLFAYEQFKVDEKKILICSFNG